jgi:hypothetical protein
MELKGRIRGELKGCLLRGGVERRLRCGVKGTLKEEIKVSLRIEGRLGGGGVGL